MPRRIRAWSNTPKIVATIAVLGTPVICLWPETKRVNRSENVAPSVDCSTLEAEVKRLVRRTRDLDSRLKRFSDSNADAAPQPEAIPIVVAAAPLALASEAEAEEEEALETYEARFTRTLKHEHPDQQRSLQVARQLATQLARTSPDTRVESVECTSTICRCVLQHQTRWAQRSIDSSLADLELLNLGVEYNYDEADVSPRTIAYVTL